MSRDSSGIFRYWHQGEFLIPHAIVDSPIYVCAGDRDEKLFIASGNFLHIAPLSDIESAFVHEKRIKLPESTISHSLPFLVKSMAIAHSNRYLAILCAGAAYIYSVEDLLKTQVNM